MTARLLTLLAAAVVWPAAAAVNITTPAQLQAIQNVPFSITLGAAGGKAPYSWTLTAVGLPWLSLTPAGVLSGTPPTTGSFPFLLTATDKDGQTDSQITTLVVNPPLAIVTASLPPGVSGTPYSATLDATGGVTPYTWTITGLPAGLMPSASGQITGTTTATGTFNVSAKVADSFSPPQSVTKAFTLVIAAPLTITNSSLPGGVQGTQYSATLQASGGTTPYTWSVAGGTLPAGLQLNSTSGAITGTPTAIGSSNVTFRVTDGLGASTTKLLAITVAAPALSITTTTLPNGTSGTPYTATLASSGGTTPYSWSITTGRLPAGLELSSSGAITGTPTATGTSNFTVRVTDAANASTTQALSLTIAAPALTITTTSLPDATVGISYTATLTVSGGTPPFSWSIVNGALPAGLQFNSTGEITGTPTAAVRMTFTVQVTDATNTSKTQILSINVVRSALAITTTSLPAGTRGTSYTATLSATGGTTPYTWSIAAGALPSGLQLSSTGAITGSPTSTGTANFTVRVTDAANVTATQALSITVAAPPLSITTTSMPTAVAGTPYVTALSATGGTTPYTWSLVSGPLPPGVSVAPAGQLAGTPTTPGTYSFRLRVSDSGKTSAEQGFSLRVLEALMITSCPVPNAVVGQAYSSTTAASGGAPPYTWSVASGQLPPGLVLNDTTGAIAGTPTQNGNFVLTLRVTDAAAATANRTCGINVGPALSISTLALPNGVVGVGYSQPFSATGGTGPYTWSIVSGSLPPGLSLTGTNGNIAGIPTQTGTFPFRIRVTDAAGTQRERDFQLTIAAGVTVAACPTGTASVGEAYNSPLAVSGGEGPYSWSIAGGQIPPGLQIQGDVLRGTVTSAGQYDYRLQVSDRLGGASTRDCSIQVLAQLTIVTNQLAGGNIDVPYSERVVVGGGVPPYAWSTSAGALPPGLFLNSGTGQITGAPTNVGTFPFTIRVIDSAGVVQDAPLSIAVTSSFQIAACPTPAATVGQAYIAVLSAVGGQTPYAWTVSSGSLPAGLTLNGSSGVISGNPTQAGDAGFVLTASDAAPSTVTRSCSIVVAPATLFVSDAGNLPQATLSVPYSATLSASGGRGPYSWILLDGSLPPGLQLGTNGQIQGVPTMVGSYTFTVRVTDADRTIATQVLTIVTTPAASPGVHFTGTSAIVAPAQQMAIGVDIDRAYPVDIAGTLRLAFEPDSGLVDDPAVQFAAGGRSVPFTIPANTTHAVFTGGANGLQTGTVSGSIRLDASLRASGVDVTPSPVPQDTMRIDRLSPRITSVTVNRTANGIEVQIAGYSTTREVTSGTFRFTPATGSSLQNTEVTVQMTDAARQWFNDARSSQYGSQFLLVQPFTVQGASVSAVSVTLTNGQGTSAAASANF